MANSADPDQLLLLKPTPTDLDLHCLQRQDLTGFSRTRVKTVQIHRLTGTYCNGTGVKITSTAILWKPASVVMQVEWLALSRG